jgi:hypothetical protein
MTTPTSCRVTALALLLPLSLALPGCGGVSSAADDVANTLVDGLVCGLRNCTESSTLNVDEISPRFTATQAAGDSAVVVSGSLGKSANVLTVVLKAPDERISASVDGSTEASLANPDGKRFDYSSRFPATSAQPVVRLVFTRGGTRHVSEVTLPPGFVVLQPTGTPLLTRSGPALPVRLSLATVGTASAIASGTCSRSDGSRFDAKGSSLGARAEANVAGGYRLDPAWVDDSLNALSRSLNNNDPKTPAVSRCELVVTWAQSVQGSVAPTLNRHGALLGQRTAAHALTYDAGL